MGHTEAHFSLGDEVEVKERDSGHWHEAIVRYATGKPEFKFVIEYKTLRRKDDTDQPLMEYVGAADVRPSRKRKESHQSTRFQLGENVEAFCWGSQRRGKIVEALGDLRYMLLLDGEKEAIGVDSSNLRALSKRDCGSLGLSRVREENTSSMETNTKRMKLKFKPIKKPRETNFSNGAMVEVRSDHEGYEGAWFTATVVGCMGDGKFLIQYETIVTEDKKHFLQEVAEEMNLRPRPPERAIHQFMASERVDVWYNEGWWVGVVSQVMDDSCYSVYFPTSHEEMVFKLSDLRPHYDWIDGRWIGTAA